MVNSFAPSIMTITLGAGPTTHGLGGFGYTLGPGGTICASPPSVYSLVLTDPTTLPRFLSYSQPTFTGISYSLADLGLYSINFVTDLYPFDRSEESTISVTVTCVHEAPIVTPTSLTFEIGITSSLPYVLAPFTQTAMSQACNVIAEMTTTPAASWLVLSPNSITGGSIVIGADLLAANAGVYTVMLVNSVIGQPDRTDSLTLTVIDPCKLAVFETVPSPFPDL
jgi:hypothetical protein